MNSNSILQSNLLDIIFENRNKDYGAYVLRRDYNRRLLCSLLAMLGLVVMFAALQMFKNKKPLINLSLIFNSPDTLRILQLQKIDRPIPQAKNIQVHTKAPKTPSEIPIIIQDDKVDKIPAAFKEIIASDAGNINDEPPSNVPLTAEHSSITSDKIKPDPPAITHQPTSFPEVMPQYPGGINEFIKFMKRNLKALRDLDENEEVMVKIKFIVSYDGTLQDFNVMQTGSKIFDDEVIRVLKKMPKWIPGKTNGDNVSVYFILPVKFTQEL